MSLHFLPQTGPYVMVKGQFLRQTGEEKSEGRIRIPKQQIISFPIRSDVTPDVTPSYPTAPPALCIRVTLPSASHS